MVDDDVVTRIRRNQDHQNLERDMKARGLDWSDMGAPIHDTHLKTKEGENGARVADGQSSSTMRDSKGKQREDAARDGEGVNLGDAPSCHVPASKWSGMAPQPVWKSGKTPESLNVEKM